MDNPTLQTIRQHRSVRAFTDEPLRDAQVRVAVEAAQCAATSSWIQAYSLLRVVDENERTELRRLTGDQEKVKAAPGFFIVCGDARRHRLLMERDGSSMTTNFEGFLAAVVDASLFAQNLVLAFESMGLGTCLIGGLRNDMAAVAKLLEIPDGVFPLYGLCVGQPAEDPGVRPRLPFEAVCFTGRYPSDETMHAAMEQGDNISEQYYVDRNEPTRTWSGGMIRRFSKTMRPELPQVYRKLGADI
jgi:FMN reductase (NADPH)